MHVLTSTLTDHLSATTGLPTEEAPTRYAGPPSDAVIRVQPLGTPSRDLVDGTVTERFTVAVYGPELTDDTFPVGCHDRGLTAQGTRHPGGGDLLSASRSTLATTALRDGQIVSWAEVTVLGAPAVPTMSPYVAGESTAVEMAARSAVAAIASDMSSRLATAARGHEGSATTEDVTLSPNGRKVTGRITVATRRTNSVEPLSPMLATAVRQRSGEFVPTLGRLVWSLGKIETFASDRSHGITCAVTGTVSRQDG